jgi:two-component system sensor histidine kinase HydH
MLDIRWCLLSNIKHQISNIKHQISNIQYPISNIQYPISNIQYPISNIQYPISNIQYQTSRIINMNLFHRLRKTDKGNRFIEDDISVWLSALAHEIKNPLNTMKLNLQLLQEDFKQPDQPDKVKTLKRLEILEKAVDRQEVILDDFMDLARLPQPKMQINNIWSLLNDILDFIEPEAQQININVVRDFHEDLPEVELDNGQIKQALLNVIKNANQAMPYGGKLVVKAYRTNGNVAIDIIDNGTGIPPDKIDKLYDLFYSTKKDGTGLGLSITQRIIKMHGGEILVKSQEGKGSTFSIILPINHANHSDN